MLTQGEASDSGSGILSLSPLTNATGAQWQFQPTVNLPNVYVMRSRVLGPSYCLSFPKCFHINACGGQEPVFGPCSNASTLWSLADQGEHYVTLSNSQARLGKVGFLSSYDESDKIAITQNDPPEIDWRFTFVSDINNRTWSTASPRLIASSLGLLITLSGSLSQPFHRQALPPRFRY